MSAVRPEVRAFVDFYIDNAGLLASEVGYIALPDMAYERAKSRIAQSDTGTAYSDNDLLSSHDLLKP